MVSEFEDINQKSFCHENFSSVKRINIFFGINGSGKTALADCITRRSRNPVCFNTEFVKNNILLSENELVKGVRLKVGRQVNTEKKIQKLNNTISNLVETNRAISESLKASNESLHNILDLQLRQAKREFKTQKIHQKVNASECPVQALKKWIDDIDGTLPSNFENISEIESSISKTNQEFFEFRKDLNDINKLNLKKLRNMLAQTVLIPNTKLSKKVIEWLKTGIDLHNLNDNNDSQKICLFCHNTFDSKAVQIRIKPLITSQYSNFLDELYTARKTVLMLTENLNLNDLAERDFSPLKDTLEKILEMINQKILKTDEEIEIDNNLIDRFNVTCKLLVERTQDLKEKIDYLQKIKNSAEQYAKSWVGKQLLENEKYQKLEQRIESLEKKSQSNKHIIEADQKEIENLKAQESDLTTFKDICNEKFKSIGLRLKLEIDPQEEGYMIREISNIPLHLNDLSEGEKRILAFIEFFYQMRDDASGLKSNIDTIIIDDPITSLDAENSYEIIEMINSLISKVDTSESKHQLFIFTNSSQAFHSIGFKKDNLSRWCIEKDQFGKSHIREIGNEEFLNFSNYYKELFLEVGKLAFEKKSELETNDNAIFYCNKARLLFESHAYTNYNIANATSAKTNFNKLIVNYNIPDD